MEILRSQLDGFRNILLGETQMFSLIHMISPTSPANEKSQPRTIGGHLKWTKICYHFLNIDALCQMPYKVES